MFNVKLSFYANSYDVSIQLGQRVDNRAFAFARILSVAFNVVDDKVTASMPRSPRSVIVRNAVNFKITLQLRPAEVLLVNPNDARGVMT